MRFLVIIFSAIVRALLIAIIILITPSTFASDFYFEDEFDETLADNTLSSSWVVCPNWANSNCGISSSIPNVKEDGGFVSFHQDLNRRRFPYVYSLGNPLPEGDYALEFRFQYTLVANQGTGIVLSNTLPNNGDVPQGFGISIWQDSQNRLKISYDGVTTYQSQSINTSTHTLKVVRFDSIYAIYLDSNLIHTSQPTSKALKYIWMGSPTTFPNPIYNWSEFKVDSIRVIKNPIPSPTPQAITPPILLNPTDQSSISIPSLSWQQPPYSLYLSDPYRVEIDNDQDFSSPEKDYYTSNTTYTPSMDSGLWYWKVKARDLFSNWSDWSGVFSFNLSPSSVPSASPNSSPTPSTSPNPSPSVNPSPSPTPKTIASQNQKWADSLNSWQIIQELGDNLNGTLDKFTFRVSTAIPNSNQFDFTAKNSKIYDKTTNTQVAAGCVSSISDPLNGLSFNTTGVPSGYEDATIDFSCNNYSFITGHRYLIKITNANKYSIIYFGASTYGSTATDYFTGGGTRWADGNIYDYSHNSGSCDPLAYIWGDPTSQPSSGCRIWSSKNDDIYFTLSNTALPPKVPVIFIPGIGGSELVTTQDVVWSKDNGHGGIYSHSYPAGEKVWVNQNQAALLGDDDYFDILKLKADGVTPEVLLSLNNYLTPFGYSDVDSFFQSLGYTKGVDYFTFPYDWRFDVRSTTPNLDSLVEQARQKSGKDKVDIVAHSLGGLVARNYILDQGRADKVNKLIAVGVPHLGTPLVLKNLLYGVGVGYRLKFIDIPIIPGSEIEDISKNLPSMFELLPGIPYFSFYDDSDSIRPYPIQDNRDADQNGITGPLNYSQTKTFLQNQNLNQTVLNISEDFHNLLDPALDQNHGVKLYEIAGSAQPTLGQIREEWWIDWPMHLIPRKQEVFINGDDTVPLYSAALRSDSLDLSGGAKIYYVEQRHEDLPKADGTAMQTVKAILSETDLPNLVSDQKITLNGAQISSDQDTDLDLYDDSGNHTGLDKKGKIETKIPDTFYDVLDTLKYAFVKKSSKKVHVKVTSHKPKKVRIKIKHIKEDKVSKVSLYSDIPTDDGSTISFEVDPVASDSPTLSMGNQTITPDSEVEGDNTSDTAPPQTAIQISGDQDLSGNYINSVTIILSATDQSGVLETRYSLDNGVSVSGYQNPFTISLPGYYTLQVFSTDKIGNQEIPKTMTFYIYYPSFQNPLSGNSPGNNLAVQSPVNQVAAQSDTSPQAKSETLLKALPGTQVKEMLKQGILGAQKEQKVQLSKPAQTTLIDIIGAMLIVVLPIGGSMVIGINSLSSVISSLKKPNNQMDDPKPEGNIN